MPATMKQRLALSDQRANARAFNHGKRLAEIGAASSFRRPGKIHPAIFEKDYAWTFAAYQPTYCPRYAEYLQSPAALAWPRDFDPATEPSATKKVRS